jgi:hypothetical protein
VEKEGVADEEGARLTRRRRRRRRTGTAIVLILFVRPSLARKSEREREREREREKRRGGGETVVLASLYYVTLACPWARGRPHTVISSIHDI